MERPLSQQTSGLGASSPLGVVDYFNSLKGSGLPENLVNDLVRQRASNENNPEIASTSLIKEIYADQNNPARRQQILDQQLAYDQQRMRAAAPYKLLFDLPKQISEGFGNQAALNVLGARSAVDAMNQTLSAYPRMSFASVPYQGPQKYFS